MPIYDFLCNKCHHVSKDIFFHSWKSSEGKQICPKCKNEMIKCVSMIVPDVFPADGIYLEHVSADGKRFYSKKEMRAFEKKNNMTIGMLH